MEPHQTMLLLSHQCWPSSKHATREEPREALELRRAITLIYLWIVRGRRRQNSSRARGRELLHTHLKNKDTVVNDGDTKAINGLTRTNTKKPVVKRMQTMKQINWGQKD